jgi:hypothetical protein
MRTNNDVARVVIAVTESSPVAQLWRAALQCLSDSPVEVLALFLADDCWRRAASLPISCEISRIGGTVADFTAQRAEQISEEAVNQARRRMEQLACEADVAFAFEVLSESDQNRIKELISDTRSILIVPSLITGRPIYTYLEQTGCRIMLIEETGEMRDNH